MAPLVLYLIVIRIQFTPLTPVCGYPPPAWIAYQMLMSTPPDGEFVALPSCGEDTAAVLHR